MTTTALPADPRGRRTWALVALLAVGCVVAFVVSVWWGTGSIRISPVKAFESWTDPDNASRLAQVAVEARSARAVMAMAVGAALAIAGSFLQLLYRNPLASPEITGVTQGSVVAVVVYLAYGSTSTDEAIWFLPLIGCAGGLGAGLLTWAIARLGGRVDPLRMILIGVLLGGLLFSVVGIAILTTDEFSQDLIQWTVGSIQVATWDRVWILLGALAIAAPLVLYAVPLANGLGLGDDIAQGVGLGVNTARAIVLLAAATVTAAAVSLVGGIGFVGLVAPHLVRSRTGSDLRRLLPASALAGALLVAAADFAARNVRPGDIADFFGVGADVAPTTLPTGVYLALIGAPFFVHMLRRLP
ncbi:MAG: iron ABC transporter permease [Actinomycetota bacterium]